MRKVRCELIVMEDKGHTYLFKLGYDVDCQTDERTLQSMKIKNYDLVLRKDPRFLR
jgi:hypothetical protein